MAKSVTAIKKPAYGATNSAGLSRRSIAWLVPSGFVVLAIAFVSLALTVRTTPYFSFDLAITRAVQSFNPPWFDWLMHTISFTGFQPQVLVWIVLVMLALFVTGYRWESITMLFASTGISGLGYAVKFLVDRPRPSSDLVNVTQLIENGRHSFPAGHVEVNVVVMGLLIYLALTVFKLSWLRVVLIIFLGSQIALVGLTRIYEGEHWFTDVIGGYLFGSLCLILTIWLYEWGKARFFVKTKPS